MKTPATAPKRPVVVADELERQLGPAMALQETFRAAAFDWREKQKSYSGDDVHQWFEEIPGGYYVWIDSDYDAVHPTDAMLLGLIDRFEEAFDTLRRAVEEHAEWEARQREEVAR